MGVFLIASMGAIAKFLSDFINPIEIAFYRNFGVFLAFIVFLTLTNSWRRVITTRRKSAHVIRGFFGTLGLICGFYSISLLPLTIAATIYYTAPLIVVILSGPMLREYIGIKRYLAVMLGFAGAVLVIQPGSQELVLIGLVFAFFDAFFSALVQIFLRDLGKTEDNFVTVFYYMGIGAFMTFLLLPFVWSGLQHPEQYLLLFGLIIAGGLQQFSKTIGASLAPVIITSPINYSGILWSAIFSIIFWDIWPNWSVITGAIIIVLSNLFILWRQQIVNQKL